MAVRDGGGGGGGGKVQGGFGSVQRRGGEAIGGMTTDGNAEDKQTMTVGREKGPKNKL